MQLRTGAAVFDEAIPDPIAGCIKNNGAITVTTPVDSAGIKVGFKIQVTPATAASRPANKIPIA